MDPRPTAHGLGSSHACRADPPRVEHDLTLTALLELRTPTFSMVYGVLERHMPQLVIESALGQGTTMRLLLPLAQGDGELYTQPAEVEERTAPLRIVVIDDDPLLRQSLQDVLQTEGHMVTVAEGGVAGSPLQEREVRYEWLGLGTCIGRR